MVTRIPTFKTSQILFFSIIIFILVLHQVIHGKDAGFKDVTPDDEKRSCIQSVDGYAYLSEDMTLSETRKAAFANAKRQAVENAKTFIISPLPEWGLIFVTMMVFLGLMVKFKVTPKWIRRFVYRLHTGLATFSIMIILLVVGHLIVD